MAHYRHLLLHTLPHGDRPPHGRLRSSSRDQQKTRTEPQCSHDRIQYKQHSKYVGLSALTQPVTETVKGDLPGVNESSSLLVAGNDSKAAAERKGTVVKAALYSVQVFYSFFIMYGPHPTTSPCRC
jgi:hypothetical protein